MIIYNKDGVLDYNRLDFTNLSDLEAYNKYLESEDQETEPLLPKKPKAIELDVINTKRDKSIIDDYIQFVKDHTTYISLFPIAILPNKLNIIIAPSNAGKSAYLQNLSIRAALEEKKVLYLTAEQDSKEIGRKFRAKEDALVRDNDSYNGVDIIYLESNVEESLIRIMRAISQKQYDIICYDYIKFSTLVTSKDSYLAISMLTDLFYKHVVLSSNNTVFFAAIQANTTGQSAKVEDIVDRWPSLVDGGGGAGRHADNVVWLKREEGYSSLILCKLRDESNYQKGEIFNLKYVAESETYIEKYAAKTEIKPSKINDDI